MERISVIALFILIFLLSACADEKQAEDLRLQETSLQSIQLRTFQEIWSTLDDNYIYQDHFDSGIEGLQGSYLEKVKATDRTSEEFASLMNEMLMESSVLGTRIESRSERIERLTADPGVFEGIGSYVTARSDPEPRIILLSIIPDSPAEMAGLKAHEAIIAIDGQPLSRTNTAAEIDRIRGAAGSEVLLTIRTPENQEREVPVIRDEIASATERLFWERTPGENVGYFLFPPAGYQGIENDFVLGLELMRAVNELEAIVLDLRIVASGQTWPANNFLSLFTDGYLGEFYSKEESIPLRVSAVEELRELQDIPLALIIGPETTAAAEIFAGILQERENSIVIGQSTPGVLETIGQYLMPDGSTLLLPTSSFQTRDGYDIGKSGVSPDVMVEIEWDEVTTDNDAVRGLAVELLKDSYID